jgi:D-alanine-D-alanine ligase-like ATP-grasp enzyme
VTGIYAKVAHEGYFTTNLARKGKVLTVNQAIDRSNLKGANTDKLLGDIDNAALRVAQKLAEVSPHHRIWGLDMGIDSDGKLWIIEANSKPGMKGFKRLKNGSMYKTIQEYKKGEG